LSLGDLHGRHPVKSLRFVILGAYERKRNRCAAKRLHTRNGKPKVRAFAGRLIRRTAGYRAYGPGKMTDRAGSHLFSLLRVFD
jgi:hypothetical protein